MSTRVILGIEAISARVRSTTFLARGRRYPQRAVAVRTPVAAGVAAAQQAVLAGQKPGGNLQGWQRSTSAGSRQLRNDMAPAGV